MRRDVVIARYLEGEMSRQQACEELGVDVINQVDQAKTAIDEDIEWALS